MLTIFVLEPILACVIWKVKAGWPSCWPICPLVYHRHPTSTWILCGCLAPWSVEESDWVDWGNPETSSPHRLSHYSIYALLGGTVLLHYADVPSLSDRRDKLCRDFFQKVRDHLVASTICCHQPVTPTSPPDSEEHPYTLDLVIEPLQIIHPPCSFKIPIASTTPTSYPLYLPCPSTLV